MPESTTIERLREALEQLDVPSSTLKRDPWGETWLPPELQALVADDPACREELRRFVVRELELYGSVRQRAELAFTARVLKAAEPVEVVGAGLDPRLRSGILGLFYALATIVGYVTLAPLIGLAGRGSWVVTLHEMLGLSLAGRPEFTASSRPEVWGPGLLGAAIAFALVVALLPWRRASPRS